MRMLLKLYLGLSIVMLAGCEKHEWEGLVYPKSGQMPYDLTIGHFSSLEDCRASALALISKLPNNEEAIPDYECGYKCEIANSTPEPGMLSTRICEKTAK